MIQTNEQFSAAQLKIQGLTPTATTNANGSVWDRMIMQTASGANTFGIFQSRWKVGQIPAVTFIDLGTNLITLPTTAHYPPP